MGQEGNQRLSILIKEAYEWLTKKDKLIFDSKIHLFNLSRSENLSDEQLKIYQKKLKLDFDIVHLNIESTVQGIVLQLLTLKEKQTNLKEFYLFFKAFTLKKQPSYVILKQKNLESNDRSKESNSKIYQEEQIALMQKFVTNMSQLETYKQLLDKMVQLFSIIAPSLTNTTSYSKGKLIENRVIMQELLDFEYKENVFDENKFRNYFKLIVFVYEGIVLEEVNAYPARKIDRNFKNSGFRATAYEVKHGGLKEVYFIFKGTEGTITTLRNMFSDVIYNNLISEALADWKYNFESIILGTGKAQVLDGLQFVRVLKKHLKPQRCYAAGHSLGGHLAQTIQLVDAPFEKVYTINSAPIQIRQLHGLKPHLLSSKKWDELMNQQVEVAEWSHSTNEYINEVFNEYSKSILNESFQSDFTRTLIYLHGTSMIGDTNYYGINLKEFPYKYNIREYFTENDLLYLYELMEDTIEWNQKKEGTKSVLKGLFSIMNEKNKSEPSPNDKKRTTDLLLNLLNYMEDNFLGDKEEIEKKRISILSGEPVEDKEQEQTKKKQLSSVLSSLKNDFSFIFNLKKDTLELIIYLHGMSGGKWIMRTGKLEEKN